MTVKLPDAPSALIRLALDDLRKCETSAKYWINMGEWHGPNDGDHEVCDVCLAGAVMAQSLDADSRAYTTPGEFGNNSKKLTALDSFRAGSVHEGLQIMGREQSPLPDFLIPEYFEDDSEPFHEAMEMLADKLERVGL